MLNPGTQASQAESEDGERIVDRPPNILANKWKM
jgi:hypothetical protein